MPMDANGRKLVDGGGVEVRSVASLEDGTTLGTKVLAQRPLVNGATSKRVD